jgi:hypothetical protein
VYKAYIAAQPNVNREKIYEYLYTTGKAATKVWSWNRKTYLIRDPHEK